VQLMCSYLCGIVFCSGKMAKLGQKSFTADVKLSHTDSINTSSWKNG